MLRRHQVHRHGGRRLAIAVTLGVAFAGLLSACGSSSPTTSSSASASASSSSGTSSSSTPYRVLFVCPLSGPLAGAGTAEKDGLQAAAAQVNSQGGVMGHKVVVVTKDDADSGTQAVSIVQSALASGTPYNMIMGGCFGEDAVPLSASLAKTPILDLAPLNGDVASNPAKYPNEFLNGSLLIAPEVALVSKMKADGITKFAIVTGGGATGQLGAQTLQQAAKQGGLTVTATELVPATSVDATTQMQAALASHPQAIGVPNYTAAIGPILKARNELGSTIPLYGDAYFSAANLALVSTAAQRKGVIEEAFPQLVVGNPAEKTAAWQAFVKYDKTYDPKPLLSLYADLTSWDSLMTARAAAVKAGTISGAAVGTALAGLSSSSQVPGFLGPKGLYTTSVHAWQVAPSDYAYVPAGISPAGLIISGK